MYGIMRKSLHILGTDLRFAANEMVQKEPATNQPAENGVQKFFVRRIGDNRECGWALVTDADVMPYRWIPTGMEQSGS